MLYSSFSLSACVYSACHQWENDWCVEKKKDKLAYINIDTVLILKTIASNLNFTSQKAQVSIIKKNKYYTICCFVQYNCNPCIMISYTEPCREPVLKSARSGVGSSRSDHTRITLESQHFNRNEGVSKKYSLSQPKKKNIGE